jgi:hypothetical protein
MANEQIQKILAQNAPLAATQTVAYTAPTQGRAIVKSLFVCNRGAAAATFSIAIVPGGGAPSVQEYIFFNQNLNGTGAPPNTYSSDVPLYLNSSDEINIQSSTAGFSFTFFGFEE